MVGMRLASVGLAADARETILYRYRIWGASYDIRRAAALRPSRRTQAQTRRRWWVREVSWFRLGAARWQLLAPLVAVRVSAWGCGCRSPEWTEPPRQAQPCPVPCRARRTTSLTCKRVAVRASAGPAQAAKLESAQTERGTVLHPVASHRTHPGSPPGCARSEASARAMGLFLPPD